MSAQEGSAKTSSLTIAKMRLLWQQGYTRNYIARETGVAPITVSRHCADLPRSVEHRGRKKTRLSLLNIPDEEPLW